MTSVAGKDGWRSEVSTGGWVPRECRYQYECFMNPQELRYSQSSIGNTFQDGRDIEMVACDYEVRTGVQRSREPCPVGFSAHHAMRSMDVDISLCFYPGTHGPLATEDPLWP